jgi:hypothetical protein
MSIVRGSLIVTVLATGAIAAMLLVRRRAPEGSYFGTVTASRCCGRRRTSSRT